MSFTHNLEYNTNKCCFWSWKTNKKTKSCITWVNQTFRKRYSSHVAGTPHQMLELICSLQFKHRLFVIIEMFISESKQIISHGKRALKVLLREKGYVHKFIWKFLMKWNSQAAVNLTINSIYPSLSNNKWKRERIIKNGQERFEHALSRVPKLLRNQITLTLYEIN